MHSKIGKTSTSFGTYGNAVMTLSLFIVTSAFGDDIGDRLSRIPSVGIGEIKSDPVSREVWELVGNLKSEEYPKTFLANLLETRHNPTKKVAAMALVLRGQADEQSLNILLSSLTEDCGYFHTYGGGTRFDVFCLSNAGTPIVRKLLNLTGNESQSSRLAVSALRMIDVERDVLNEFMTLLKEEKSTSRQVLLIDILANTKSNDKALLRLLEASSASTDTEIEIAAMKALGRLRFANLRTRSDLLRFSDLGTFNGHIDAQSISHLATDWAAILGRFNYISSLRLPPTTSPQELGTILNSTSIKSLNLTDSHVNSEGLLCLKSLKRTHSLILEGATNVDDNVVKAMSQLSKLRRLDLKGTAVTDKGISLLSRLPALEYLRLNSRMTSSSRHAIVRIKTLRLLNIYPSQLTSNDVLFIKVNLPNCRVAGRWKDQTSEANKGSSKQRFQEPN